MAKVPEKVIEKWDKSKTVFFSVLLWGLFAHGFMLFQKLSIHDDITDLIRPLLNVNMRTGRWGSVIIQFLQEKIYGFVSYSSPAFLGLLFLGTLFVFCILLFRLFRIENKWMQILLTGFVVCSPLVLATFGYIYACLYVSFGLLACVAGCCLICTEKPTLIKAAVGILCICFSTAVYQTFFSLALTIVLLYFLNRTEEGLTWKGFVIKFAYYLGSCIASILIYLGLTKLSLSLAHLDMDSYAGLDTMGSLPISEYLKRIPIAYKEFFYPTAQKKYTIYVFNTRFIYLVLLILAIVAVLYQLIKIWKSARRSAIQMVILLALFPLASNSILVFAGEEPISAMHMYSQFIVMFFILQRLSFLKDAMKPAPSKYFGVIFSALLLLMNIMFAHYSNECYTKVAVVQTEVTQYFNRLIERIESTEGYDDEMPVIYLNEFEKKDAKINGEMPYWDELSTIPPYNLDELNVINDYNWKTYVIIWCGFWPEVQSPTEELLKNETVKSMPHYPDDGSVRVIDDAVVVKF